LTSIQSCPRPISHPTIPPADLRPAATPPSHTPSPAFTTQHRSPEVRSTAFAARPPDLPPRSLMAVDFAIIGSLVRPGRPRYPVLVRRAATLLHAFFRPHLAMIPLRFANPSPPSGWIEDFHLQAVVQYSAHQKKAPPKRGQVYGCQLAEGGYGLPQRDNAAIRGAGAGSLATNTRHQSVATEQHS